MRVGELAKELGVSIAELMAILKSLKVGAKTAASVLDKDAVSMVKKNMRKARPKVSRRKGPEGVKAKRPKKAAPKKTKAVKRVRTGKKRLTAMEKEGEVLPAGPKIEIAEEKKEVKLEKPLPIVKEKMPAAEEVVCPAEAAEGLKVLELDLPITVKDLAVKLQEKPSVLIKRLMGRGTMAGINQALDEGLVRDICKSFGFTVKKALDEEETALLVHYQKDPLHLLKPRAPVVTLMGHVDHGKTSLLDAIRHSDLAQRESGGITQHIGAYLVNLPKGSITFLDTPGHEAFTAMRARGARITDIVVLVVAADDAVMPQTVEAIDHAREAGVPIVVAINKIDIPQANIERVKKQLCEYDLTPEDWQGKTVTVSVSAKTGEGINELLEMILLESEMLELKANYQKPARGVVIESRLNKGKGYVSTLLVQNGTLRLDDILIAGKYCGKVRAMFDDRHNPISQATASVPVQVLGIPAGAEGGEQFFVVEDEKKAKGISEAKAEKARLSSVKPVERISLDDLYAEIKEGKVKELKLILKADVQGSLEAIKESIRKIDTKEIKLNIIHEAAGSINTSDVILASASNALIMGFHVEAQEKAKDLIAKEGIDVRTYNVIYELGNELKNALEGLLEPEIKKTFLGRAQIRKVFELSKAGTVAGCLVTKGKVPRGADIAVIRNGAVVFEGKINSLKRFKDDVRDVGEGIECGISISGLNDIKEGDIIEAYEIKKIARKL